MNTTPLISVIIPFYNVERYLEEAIESVLRQTYNQWEMLLLDDGSMDGSTEIALRYARNYPDKIRYLHHPGKINKGLPATRNLGVKNAEGDWLALLDADDCWLPDKLQHQITIARQHPEVVMICGASLYWYSWSDPQKKDVAISVGAPQNRPIAPPQAAVTLYPLGKGAAPCPCCVMIRKDIAIRHGAFEDRFRGKYALYEDQAFFIKIYLHETIYVSSEVTDRYRQREDSIMSKSGQDNNYHEVRYYYMKWLQNYLEKEDINNQEVYKKLKEALKSYEKSYWEKAGECIKRHLLRLKT